MLSNDNIRRINREIEDRLRTLSSICSSDQEKEEARKDLIVLNDLLLAWQPKPETPKVDDYTVRHIATELRRLFER